MKPTTALLALGTLFSTCAADFWIYEAGGFGDQVPITYFSFYHDVVKCSDLGSGKGQNYLPYENVSKRKGISCDGNGCEGGNPNQVTRFEMNVDWGHYTIYKDRGWKMYDTSDRVVGQCRPDRSKSWLCPGKGLMDGASMFWCQTSVDKF
ncbi:hypothetical protein QBC41DRAFT_305239 [Cercophora samala]|uniref:Secreted protein n=1 Tax=Cercophora samala TaxID=330535 RepID=A0AA39Z901_9PEZI|nr:hypothetical protein QBC41DRAFT_305239 [Cercophora samala]